MTPPLMSLLRPAIEESEKCWCGEQAHHKTWCFLHAPRCRSGAHFLGNCLCIGDGYLAKSPTPKRSPVGL